MPFIVKKVGAKYKVVTKETGKVHGTHSTKAEADKQVRALYTNVLEARR